MSQFVGLNCPNCAGKVRIQFINDRRYAICEFCGSSFLLEEDKEPEPQTNNIVENQTHSKPKAKTVFSSIGLVLLLAGIVMCVIAFASKNQYVNFFFGSVLVFFAPACLFFSLRLYGLSFAVLLFWLLVFGVNFMFDNSWSMITAAIGLVCMFSGIMILIFVMKQTNKENKTASKRNKH